jgi:surface antigen
MSTLASYLAWAQGQLGTLEDPLGSNKNPYAAIAGHADGAPWCATFVVAASKVTGLAIPTGAGSAWTPGNAKAYQAAGRYSSTPVPGSTGFVFYPWLDGGRIGHTFIVEAVPGDGTVITIEGNTNNDGSRTGIGVFRHRRPVLAGAGSEGVAGYGLNVFASAPVVITPPHLPNYPVISLSKLVNAASKKGQQGTYRAGVQIVQSALAAEPGVGLDFSSGPGVFGPRTKAAYARWQKQCGYSGSGADGVPGRASLTRLGQRRGFTVGK